MAAIVVVFGAIGFGKVYPNESGLDSLYRALQLFAFGGNVNSHPNAWLEIARFLGPFVVGYAAVQAITALYREQLQLLRFRMMRNHVVVAGLGTAGFMMATAFDRDDWHVVVIEQDAMNPSVKGCRELGIGVVLGDARDRHVLRKAGLKRAILLVVMCGRDGTNVDVASGARVVTRDRPRGILTTLVELDDFELWGVMKAQALLDRDGSPFRLELFNSFALAGEMLLHEHPPFDPKDPGSPHILLVGTHGVGYSLVIETVKRWLAACRSPADRLRITLASPSAVAERDQLIARVPGLDRVTQFELGTWTVDLVGSGQPKESPSHVSAVYISLSSETAALNVALTLRQQAGFWETVPITVAVVDESAGVGGTVSRGGPALERVSAFGVFRRTLTPLALLHTVTEEIARLSHKCHVRDRIARGDTEEGDPSLVPWNKLPDALRESNRLFADGIPAKLADLGCVVVTAPLMEPNERLFTFSDAEIERLAPGEHERWQTHMKRIGYHAGDPKDHLRKRHPLIDVPYGALPEENKEKDRAHVRAIPEILARAGFRIRRLGDPPPVSAETRRPELAETPGP